MTRTHAFDAVYRLASHTYGSHHFGTAFGCYADADGLYLLTSAQIVATLGGPDALRIGDQHPEVIALSSRSVRDLAVLRLKLPATQAILPLAPDPLVAAHGLAVEIPGYAVLNPSTCLRSKLAARLHDEATLEALHDHDRVRVWRVQLDQAPFTSSLVGAPVIDAARGYVIGMVIQAHDTGQALAIKLDELRHVWSDAPALLWQQPPLALRGDELGSPHAEARSSERLAQAAHALEQQARDLTPPDTHDQLAHLTRLLLAEISRKAHPEPPSYLGISPDLAEVIQLLAGKTLATAEASLNFGRDNQYGEVTVGDIAGRDLIKFYLTMHEAPSPQATPPPTPLAVPVQVYLSSEAPQSPHLQTLRHHLALRGVMVWPDEQGTILNATAHRAHLAASVAALLHLDQARLDDEALADEGARLRERHTHDAVFPIGVVLDGINQAAVRKTGLRLHDYCQFMQPYPSETGPTLPQKILKAAMQAYPERFAHQETIELSLFTFPASGTGRHAPLQLNWQAAFQPFPSEAAWRDQLLPALNDLRECLGEAGIRAIKCYPQARLSAMVAFGYIFREPTKIKLWINQHDEWWPTQTYTTQHGPALITTQAGDPAGRDLTIEVSVNADVTNDVSAYLKQAPLPLACRVSLKLPPGTQLDSDAAHAIACQVRAAIHQYRPVNGTTHLFGAMPAGLAALIGWHLNAREPVQCYELERGVGYRKACLLTG
ncbi:SAVED domain-containing protein [Candidatus Chloroploca sp. Khr17]|uniref:SAVED domain-containing protein n=1 Tax=Candidatus Chloroploca sp. Khr17 TaxID=2496869 RepID=UPI00101D45E3|nr:SAVED domain-containing protein [Candidatus Chloroploca sp. Khr17]